ncbi:cytochrome b/b6 domain-containing protein [Inmirania thermothiophila]|uniref:Cytochrome b n=1 Tax=Inmirania thermothiophila TaxID=1750597 RepID=A0A3N1Y743_9GAMM|nr:cytochrome b/b6 domain-containing protein [Inmirania thermothiophila]ROR34644.1 cytochrome b [Inmirania thermothiophila]
MPASGRPRLPAAADTVPVWDLPVRVGHWTLVAAVTVAWASDGWLWLHVAAGEIAAVAVALRLAWGFVGTRHARFRDFVRPPREALAYLRAIAAGDPPRHLGHNPAGGWMVLALLAAVGTTTATGLALHAAAEGAGPLAGLVPDLGPRGTAALAAGHELLADGVLVLAAAHVAGVLAACVQHREDLVAALFHGRKRRTP